MIIDCHYHLEERVYPVDRLIAEMEKAGVDRVALMGSMIEPFKEPPVFLVRALQSIFAFPPTKGLARSLVSGFTPDGGIRILGRPYRIEPDPDNEHVFNTVRKHPDKFLGWAFVNPRGKKDPVREFEAYKDAAGFVGIKAHPFWHHFKPVELTPVAERLAETGKPLLIHAGFGAEGDIGPLLENVPGLKLILAHGGFPGYADTWKKIRPHKNVYLDLSQTTYTSEKTTRAAVEFLGAERLFFGTDGPYGFHGKDRSYDYGFIKRRIERLFPDGGTRERLLGKNFADVTGLTKSN